MERLIPRTRGQGLTGETQLTGIQLGKAPVSVLPLVLPAAHYLEQIWDNTSTNYCQQLSATCTSCTEDCWKQEKTLTPFTPLPQH